jgi:hypothetical protein
MHLNKKHLVSGFAAVALLAGKDWKFESTIQNPNTNLCHKTGAEDIYPLGLNLEYYLIEEEKDRLPDYGNTGDTVVVKSSKFKKEIFNFTKSTVTTNYSLFGNGSVTPFAQYDNIEIENAARRILDYLSVKCTSGAIIDPAGMNDDMKNPYTKIILNSTLR